MQILDFIISIQLNATLIYISTSCDVFYLFFFLHKVIDSLDSREFEIYEIICHNQIILLS